jgi:hypothetical protein
VSYQSLTRNMPARDLRPTCAACRTATERPNAVIEHPPGDETQSDWLESPDPPASRGWRKAAYLLVGSLAHSGKWRSALSPLVDQLHLIAAVDQVLRGPGGLAGWPPSVTRTLGGDRFVRRGGQALRASVTIWPPRRGNRKGGWKRSNTLPPNVGGAPWPTTHRRGGSGRCGPLRPRPWRYPTAGHADGRSSVVALAKTEGRVPRHTTVGGIIGSR